MKRFEDEFDIDEFRSRVLYRDPSTVVPICVSEGIDLGAPAGKVKKKKKEKKDGDTEAPPATSEE